MTCQLCIGPIVFTKVQNIHNRISSFRWSSQIAFESALSDHFVFLVITLQFTKRAIKNIICDHFINFIDFARILKYFNYFLFTLLYGKMTQRSIYPRSFVVSWMCFWLLRSSANFSAFYHNALTCVTTATDAYQYTLGFVVLCKKGWAKLLTECKAILFVNRNNIFWLKRMQIVENVHRKMLHLRWVTTAM